MDSSDVMMALRCQQWEIVKGNIRALIQLSGAYPSVAPEGYAEKRDFWEKIIKQSEDEEMY